MEHRVYELMMLSFIKDQINNGYKYGLIKIETFFYTYLDIANSIKTDKFEKQHEPAILG